MSFELLEMEAMWERSVGEFGSHRIHTLRTRKYKEILSFFTADENQNLAQAFVFELAQRPDVIFSNYASLFDFTPHAVEALLESEVIGNQEIAGSMIQDKPLDHNLEMYQEFLKLVEKEPSLVVPFIRDIILYSKAGFNLNMMAVFAESSEEVNEMYKLRHPREAAAYQERTYTEAAENQQRVVIFPQLSLRAAAD